MRRRRMCRMMRRVRSPRSWPIWVRRTFILTLPLAVPGWILALAVTALLAELSRGAAWLQDFMTAAPRTGVGSGYYRGVCREPGDADIAPGPFHASHNSTEGPPGGESCRYPVLAVDNSTRPLAAPNLNVADEGPSPPAVAEVVRMRTWNWADGTPLDRVG